MAGVPTQLSSIPWPWVPGLFLLLGLGVATVLCARTPAERETHGPFAIEARTRKVGAGGFPNLSGNPLERTDVSAFRLYHGGKRVAVDAGNGISVDEFWEARFLDDAPRPTVLLATTGLWLITEDHGTANVQRLVEQETAGVHWQWLDGADGQPLAPTAVGIRDARGQARGERAGSLLLINNAILLDVHTLAVQRLRLTDSAILQQADGYNGSNRPVLRLSPGRTQYALLGERAGEGRTEYAVVVADPGRQQAYALPLDRNATRLADAAGATPAWFEHHFAWSADASGTERLAPRGLAPLPWLGRLVHFGPVQVEYRLPAAGPGLRPTLAQFLVDRFGVQMLASTEQEPTESRFRVRGFDYRIVYDPQDRSLNLVHDLGLHATPPAAYALIVEAGEAFNALLATPAHQEQFAGLPD